MFKTVVVKFPRTNQEYSYYTDLELEEDDVVVVEAKGFYGVATVDQVLGIHEAQSAKATKWVVSKLDTTAHDKRMEQRKLVQEIVNKLEKRRKAVELKAMYELLADKDPEIKALLVQLKEVDPNDKLLVTE